MKKLFIVLLTLVLHLFFSAHKISAAGYWQLLTPSPDYMFFNGAAFDGQRYLYIIGGFNTDFSTSNRFQRYDTLVNTWEIMPPAPESMVSTKMLYINNALFVLPGTTGDNRSNSREFLEYDLATNSWSHLPNIPGSYASSGWAAYDGQNTIYAGTFSGGYFSGTQYEHIYKFDIPSSTWTEIPQPPLAAVYSLFLSDTVGRLYKIGGVPTIGPFQVYKNVQRYDPLTNSWQQLNLAPEGIFEGAGTSDNNGHFYINAGYRDDGNTQGSSFFKYTVDTDSWERLSDTPAPMANNIAVWDGSSVLVTGGLTTNSVLANTLYRYNPDAEPPPNTAPKVDSIPNVTINEGETFMYAGSFNDTDSISWRWTATVDYDDESGLQPLALSGTNFLLSHTYKDNGIYTVRVSVTDNQGVTGTRTGTITVNNMKPSVGIITAPINPVQVNTPIFASASFTDPGVVDTHIANWDWGDRITNDGTITESNGAGSVSDSHTYTAAGLYTITLIVTDKDGESKTSDPFQYVVVYEPSGGYVTGAGTITSSLGSYTQDPSLSGKAIFGFVSRYQNGATIPTGSTQFRFTVANFEFKSTSYDWLVIGGAKAQYKGSGKINGSGDRKS